MVNSSLRTRVELALLVGVDVSGAFLEGVDLNGANLLRANFRSADIRDGSFVGSQLEYADLTSANAACPFTEG
jgi:uncharacterized protein YjbI with pentapeptide repeats